MRFSVPLFALDAPDKLVVTGPARTAARPRPSAAMTTTPSSRADGVLLMTATAASRILHIVCFQWAVVPAMNSAAALSTVCSKIATRFACASIAANRKKRAKFYYFLLAKSEILSKPLPKALPILSVMWYLSFVCLIAAAAEDAAAPTFSVM